MSRLAELIEELCPDGVEYKPLGELLVYQQPTPFLVSSKDYDPSYPTPVLTAGATFLLGYSSETHGVYAASTDDPVIIFDDFTTASKWVDFPFKLKSSAAKILTAADPSVADIRFLYFLMQTIKYQVGSHARHWIAVYSKMPVCCPPLEVQREIVRILDQFTTLEAELEAELEARRTQYEHYRNQLLSYESLAARGPVEMVKLGELAHIATGGRNTSDAVENGTYPFYVRSQVPLSLNEYDFDESAVLTAGDGVGVGKVFHHVEGKYALHQRAYRLVPNLELLSSRYLYHVMVSQFGRYLESTVFHSSVTSVRKPMLERFPVAVPPMEEQDRVADVLDRFNALVNDITSGLPAEIAARRAQYEHYRDRLLSFPEKVVSVSDAS